MSCPVCRALVRPPADADQLSLFPPDENIRLLERRPMLPADVDENVRYWSYRYKATQATRRKYPYH